MRRPRPDHEAIPRRSPLVLAIVVLAVLVSACASGGAAPRAPAETLSVLPGPTGCVTAPDDSAPTRRPDDGCALGRGLRQVHHVALSPDERFLYTAVGTVKLPPDDDGTIGVYRRDARTGGIVQLRGARGCVKRVASPYGGDGCATARNLQGTRFVAVGPEGRTLYSAGVSGISVFRRDPASGVLRQLRGPVGCFNADGAHRCARLPAPRGWRTSRSRTAGGSPTRCRRSRAPS
jgi:hypothetical protein